MPTLIIQHLILTFYHNRKTSDEVRKIKNIIKEEKRITPTTVPFKRKLQTAEDLDTAIYKAKGKKNLKRQKSEEEIYISIEQYQTTSEEGNSTSQKAAMKQLKM